MAGRPPGGEVSCRVAIMSQRLAPDHNQPNEPISPLFHFLQMREAELRKKNISFNNQWGKLCNVTMGEWGSTSTRALEQTRQGGARARASKYIILV